MPAHESHIIDLNDESRVWIRPIQASDNPAVKELILGVGREFQVKGQGFASSDPEVFVFKFILAPGIKLLRNITAYVKGLLILSTL